MQILLTAPTNSQTTSSQGSIITEPQYPGGMEALYKYVNKNTHYPVQARARGIEGTVFMQFVIGESGRIKPETIKIVRGIDAECDKEAERIIKSNDVAWIPAFQDGKAIPFTFHLAIKFQLTSNDTVSEVFTPLDQPFKAIVKVRAASTSSREWPIYADLAMESKIGKVLPGDSVQVDGWAPWLFHITGKTNGFIAFRSISVPAEFSNLVQMIENESTKMVREKEHADSVHAAQKNALWGDLINLQSSETLKKNRRVTDSIELKDSPLVFLRLSSSKKEIFVGECAVVSLALYIDLRDSTLLQFPKDFGLQFSRILQNQLLQDNCWVASGKIEKITGRQESIGGRLYTVYTIFSAGYCPIDSNPLIFKPITIEFEKYKGDYKIRTFHKMVPFTTKTLIITIKPITPSIHVTNSDFYRLVGKFKVMGTFDSKSCATGKPCLYSITLEGSGLSFPITVPALINPNFTSRFVGRVHMDTIINNEYYSRTTFNYRIEFRQTGNVDLSQKVFTGFDPVTKTQYDLNANSTINVPEIASPESKEIDQTFLLKNNFILIDISQSMQIEDYEPNRLAFVRNALTEFLLKRKMCDTDLVLFSGDVMRYNISTPDSCYAQSLLNKVNFNLLKERGTAMGDAIWFVTQPLVRTSKTKKLILIGDGENTSGITSLGVAAKLALKRNVKIYTIGVGHNGPVKFGTNLNGSPNMIPQTFSDADLKKIAEQSGGKYFWAGNKTQFINALTYIFSLP